MSYEAEMKRMVETEYVEKKEQAIEEAVAFEIEQNAMRGLVKMLQKLDDESLLFSVSEKAMRIFAINSAHTALAMGFINRESFKRYEISNDHAFAVYNSDLNAMLALSDKKSLVHFIKKGHDIYMETDDGFSQDFTIDMGGKTISVPGIMYNQGDLVGLKGLYEAVKYAADVGSDAVKLVKDGNGIVIQFRRGNVLLEKRLDVQSHKETKPITDGIFGSYPTDELYKLLKGMKDLCGDVPVMVRMKFDDKASKNGTPAPLKLGFRAEIDGKGANARTIKGYGLVAPRMEQ